MVDNSFVRAVEYEYAVKYLEFLGIEASPRNIANILLLAPFKDCVIVPTWETSDEVASTFVIHPKCRVRNPKRSKEEQERARKQRKKAREKLKKLKEELKKLKEDPKRYKEYVEKLAKYKVELKEYTKKLKEDMQKAKEDTKEEEPENAKEEQKASDASKPKAEEDLNKPKEDNKGLKEDSKKIKEEMKKLKEDASMGKSKDPSGKLPAIKKADKAEATKEPEKKKEETVIEKIRKKYLYPFGIDSTLSYKFIVMKLKELEKNIDLINTTAMQLSPSEVLDNKIRKELKNPITVSCTRPLIA